MFMEIPMDLYLYILQDNTVFQILDHKLSCLTVLEGLSEGIWWSDGEFLGKAHPWLGSGRNGERVWRKCSNRSTVPE